MTIKIDDLGWTVDDKRDPPTPHACVVRCETCKQCGATFRHVVARQRYHRNRDRHVPSGTQLLCPECRVDRIEARMTDLDEMWRAKERIR